MAAETVVYSIELRDMFSAIAEKLGAVVRGLNKTMGGLGTATKEAQAALNSLKVPTGFGAINNAANDVRRSVAGIGTAAKETTAQLARMGGAADAIKGWGSGRSPMGIGRDVERSARRGGGLGTGLGLLALSQVGRNDVLSKNIDFDEQIRLLRSVAVGASDSQIEGMRNSILDTASGSIFTPTEIAKAYHDMAIRGMPLDQIPTIVKQVRGLAAGTGEEIGKTAGVHLDILRQYDMPVDAKHIRHVSDVLGAAQLSTGSTLEDLKQAYKMAGPASSLFGLSMEDTAMLAGGLSLKGIRGSLSGTGLRRAFTGLEKWNSKSSPLWEGAGFQKGDFVDFKTGKLKDMVSVLQQLHDKVTPEKMGAMGMTPMEFYMRQFGDRAGPVIAALVSNLDKLKEIRENLGGVDGLAERMGDKGGKGLSAAMKQLTSAWEGLDLAIGKSGFNENIEWLARGFNSLLKSLSGGGHQGLLQAAGWIAMLGNAASAAAMPLLTLSLLSGPIKKVAMSLMSLRAATGLGAALLIADTVYEHWDRLAAALERTKNAWEALTGGKGSAGDVAKGVTDFAANLMPGELGTKLQDQVTKETTGASPSANAIVDGIQGAVKSIQSQTNVKIDIPESIRIQVDATGANGTRGSSSADLPITAAPRGTHQDAPGAWQKDN